MRVATANSFNNTVDNLTRRQAELSALQDRISTGKRVQRASDDPVAAVLSEAAQNRLSRVEVDQRAINASRTSLAQAESTLGSAGELIQDVRDLLVAAGNATYGSNEFKDIAQQIEGYRERMIALANQTDTSGRTLFGGLGGTSQPFVEVYGPSGGGGVQFQGQRGQEATGNNSLPQSFDGEAIWMRVPQGNGTFTLDLAPGNTGSVRTDIGQVTNLSALTGHDYSIAFADVAGSMTFTVTDTTSGTPVAGLSGVPYSDGSTVEFDGMSFQMNGVPADGDVVDLHPVTATTDIFKVMQDAVDALRSASGPGAPLTQALGRSLTELDAGHDRVLKARSLAGAWLNRADSVDGRLSDQSVELKAEKSGLEDLDMIKGISDFQTQQTGLQAALQSYAQVQRMSLFQYIG